MLDIIMNEVQELAIYSGLAAWASLLFWFIGTKYEQAAKRHHIRKRIERRRAARKASKVM